jgi:hypothetical protein
MTTFPHTTTQHSLVFKAVGVRLLLLCDGHHSRNLMLDGPANCDAWHLYWMDAVERMHVSSATSAANSTVVR